MSKFAFHVEKDEEEEESNNPFIDNNSSRNNVSRKGSTNNPFELMLEKNKNTMSQMELQKNKKDKNEEIKSNNPFENMISSNEKKSKNSVANLYSSNNPFEEELKSERKNSLDEMKRRGSVNEIRDKRKASMFKPEDVEISAIDGDKSQNLGSGELETIEWTRQEEMAVLEMYHLETLQPTEWNDAPAMRKMESMARLNIDHPAHASIANIAEHLHEEEDPLGINAKRNKGMTLQKTISSLNLDGSGIKFSSKNFDPVAYLIHVHGSTLYSDLIKGSEKWSKKLVKQNFDRFVHAKTLVDNVYREMKDNVFRKPEFGTREANKFISESFNVSDHLYNPIIERRDKTEKIRLQLSILEQFKFFFSLPKLMKSYLIKGKFVIKSHEQDVFKHIWKEVLLTVKSIQEKLIKKLSDSFQDVNIQEKIIQSLIDLDIESDPISIYLTNQKSFIISKIDSINKKFKYLDQDILRNYEINRQSLEYLYKDKKDHIQYLRKMLIISVTDQIDSNFSNNVQHSLWNSRLNLINEINNELMLQITNLWKVSKPFHSKSKSIINQVQNILEEISNISISCINESFSFKNNLSKIASSDVLAISHYTLKIINNLSLTFNQIKSLRQNSNLLYNYAEFILNLKNSFIDFISTSLMNGMKLNFILIKK
ncbi:hypothetical protein O9G_001633 [Rozella allomycis CSF55]|uniref:Exocyst complex component SEC5 n=1 Tax=Rozella allomycis (strain CSF55) TaxID=988480 RepID=A0A075AX34_ROZAC|nr:hypothetical protein O9G_001633 [Rozella allomycis CSF55]|eukprot:EPZ33282.1 hypothetical protein O9G_001633 [Rozella allomycis CSF55]